ncbi:MAG TPA: hypothetical protein ENK05_08830 [Gammaproteobacteria bacterium]|nr:hypothetical protein [Gammaproteobacteria bacterium]
MTIEDENENGRNIPDNPNGETETQSDGPEQVDTEQATETESEPSSLLEAVTEELGGDDEGAGEGAEASDDAGHDHGDEGNANAGAEGTDSDNSEAEAEGNDKADEGGEEDDLYAPLPDDVKEKTRERFNKLVESHKALSTELETYRSENEGFREVINYSQATPEEFNQLIEYSRLVKTGDLKAALNMLDEQRAQIARLLDEPVAGVDQLADFPDLKQRVEQMELSQQDALEIAALRRREAAIREQQQAAVQQQEQATTLQQEVDRASQAIVQMVNQWQANDIDFPRKQERLMAKAQEIAERYPPDLWQQALQDVYDAMQVVQAPASETPPSPQPLRPQSGGGGKPVPRSMLQAVEQALGE